MTEPQPLTTVTGGCFCGALRYEAQVDPQAITVCHCRDCQILSGSAFFVAARIAPSDLRFTVGEPRWFEKTGGSGGKRRLAFCATCGTHLCATPGDAIAAQHCSLRIATADDFARFRPTREGFCASRLDWLGPIERG